MPLNQKKMKKNSFIGGAVFAYVALIFTKMLGALYNIPFYQLIGEKGGVIYSTAYNIYAIFLDVTVCGIPSAISIVVSEYNSTERFKSKTKAFTLALKYVSIVSLVFFGVLQIFAPQFAYFFIGDMTEGVSIGDIAMAIRAVSFCLLVAPILSVTRGYLSGHKYISASSTSQVIEQIVHVSLVLGGVFAAVHLMNLSTTIGVCVALVSTAVGAVTGLIYLITKAANNREELFSKDRTEDKCDSNAVILKKIISYCLTLTIVSIAQSVYSLVDMKLLLVGLHNLNFSDEATQVIASVNSTWTPKISMIIAALAMGMVSSIAPHMAENYARGEMDKVSEKLNQAVGTTLIISIPLSIGIMVYAEPTYRFFYGASDYGANVLMLSVIINTLGNVATVISMTMQSINRGKTVCVVTVIGILLNMVFDLPWIYLFDRIGIPAYLGACVSSIFAQLITSILLLAYLKKTMNFDYRGIFSAFLRIIPAAIAMCLVIIGMKRLWPVADGRNLMLVVHLGAVAVVGAAVYLPVSYLTGALTMTIGGGFVDRILIKLHLKK